MGGGGGRMSCRWIKNCKFSKELTHTSCTVQVIRFMKQGSQNAQQNNATLLE